MDTIGSIIKGVNIFVLLGGGVGMILYFNKNKSTKCLVLLSIIMIVWRSLFSSLSSRYFSCVLYAFSVFAALFCISLLTKTRNEVLFIVIVCVIVALFGILITTFSFSPTSHSFYAVAEYLSRLSLKHPNTVFVSAKRDYERIGYLAKFNQEFICDNILTKESVSSFINPIKQSNKNLALILSSDKISSNNSKLPLHFDTVDTYAHTFSIFAQRTKKRRFDIVYFNNNSTSISTISEIVFPSQNNILINGDLEQVDSKTESRKKFETYLPDYFYYHTFDDSTHTPFNAYFFNNPIYTQYAPFYNCTNSDPISGNYSVIIRINQGFGYFVFNQRFFNGKYKYSLLVKGVTGTKVMLYKNQNINGSFSVSPIVSFSLPDERLYRISTAFFVNEITNNDYFFIGVRVFNGEALFDNFSLESLD